MCSLKLFELDEEDIATSYTFRRGTVTVTSQLTPRPHMSGYF